MDAKWVGPYKIKAMTGTTVTLERNEIELKNKVPQEQLIPYVSTQKISNNDLNEKPEMDHNYTKIGKYCKFATIVMVHLSSFF